MRKGCFKSVHILSVAPIIVNCMQTVYVVSLLLPLRQSWMWSGHFTLRLLTHSYRSTRIFGFDFLQMSRGNGLILFKELWRLVNCANCMRDMWVWRCNCLPHVVSFTVFLLTARFKCMHVFVSMLYGLEIAFYRNLLTNAHDVFFMLIRCKLFC